MPPFCTKSHEKVRFSTKSLHISAFLPIYGRPIQVIISFEKSAKNGEKSPISVEFSNIPVIRGNKTWQTSVFHSRPADNRRSFQITVIWFRRQSHYIIITFSLLSNNLYAKPPSPICRVAPPVRRLWQPCRCSHSWSLSGMSVLF